MVLVSVLHGQKQFIDPLGFEFSNHEELFQYWNCNGEVSLDTITPISGNSSIWLKSSSESASSIFLKLNLSLRDSKLDSISIRVRGKPYQDSKLVFWINGYSMSTSTYENDKSKELYIDSTKALEHTFILNAIDFLNLGITLINGDLTLDDIEIYIDSDLYNPFHKIFNSKSKLTKALSHQKKYKSFYDLSCLKGKIYGLGESTHGIKEVRKELIRLTDFLLEETDTINLILELSVCDGVVLNQYIHGLNSDLATSLAIQDYWIWQVEQSYDLFKHLRLINDQGEKHVNVWGMISGNSLESLNILQDLLDSTKIITRSFHEYRNLHEARLLNSKASFFTEDILKKSENLKISIDSLSKIREVPLLALKTIYYLIYSLEYGSSNSVSRDQELAEHVFELLNHSSYEETATVIYAHNSHVSRQNGAMGSLIDRKFAENYVPIGSSFFRGSYLAKKDNVLSKISIQNPIPFSLEWVLGDIYNDKSIVDIGDLHLDTDHDIALMKSIGSTFKKNPFEFFSINQFDYLIFFPKVTSTNFLYD